MLRYDTLLDAAWQHFSRVAASPNYTRQARQTALHLAREAEEDLAVYNQRSSAPAWEGEPEALRAA